MLPFISYEYISGLINISKYYTFSLLVAGKRIFRYFKYKIFWTMPIDYKNINHITDINHML